MQHLKDAGVYDNTLIIVTSDNGPPFQGSKTTHYEPGVQMPLVIRDPSSKKRGTICDELVSHVDLTPTPFWILRELSPKTGGFMAVHCCRRCGGDGLSNRDEVFLSHTFHEVTMYYPMRTVRTKPHKLIWNLAHQLPYPSASDLWASSTWQAAFDKGASFRYGPRTLALSFQ